MIKEFHGAISMSETSRSLQTGLSAYIVQLFSLYIFALLLGQQILFFTFQTSYDGSPETPQVLRGVFLYLYLPSANTMRRSSI